MNYERITKININHYNRSAYMCRLIFTIKPTLDNQQTQQKQEEILKAIESGNEAIEVMLQANDDVDIYDSFDAEPIPITTPLPSATLLNTVKGIGIITIDTFL